MSKRTNVVERRIELANDSANVTGRVTRKRRREIRRCWSEIKAVIQRDRKVGRSSGTDKRDILSRRITVNSSHLPSLISRLSSFLFQVSLPPISFLLSFPFLSFFFYLRPFALSTSNLSIKNFVAPRSQRHFASLNGNPGGRVAGRPASTLSMQIKVLPFECE